MTYHTIFASNGYPAGTVLGTIQVVQIDPVLTAVGQLAMFRAADRAAAKGIKIASWRILPDLLANEERGQRVSITSACIASGTPETTGLRYVALLEEAGLIARSKDRKDQRRQHLILMPAGRDLIAACLGAAQ